MEAIKYTKTGEKIEKIRLPEYLFDADVNENVLYEIVKLYRRNQRQGTKSVKERPEVRSSGRKLYRQKGTGRARAGDAASPVRVGGGVAFGSKPKKWFKKIPRKKKRLALRSALSTKKDHIFVIEDFNFENPSTKKAKEILDKMNINSKKCLIVMPDNSRKIIKIFRNLQNVKTTRAQDLYAYQILDSNDLIITENALKKMEETFHE